MPDLKNLEDRVKADVRAATNQVAPQLEALARFGYASKGVVYGTIGLLALLLALGAKGATTDARGALMRLDDLPLGRPLLWLLALGLLGYALWQLIRAALDPEQQGKEAKGLAKRVGYLLSGIFNTGLALFAARLAGDGRVSPQSSNEQDTVRQILSWPGGQLLVGLAAVTLLAVAGNSVYSAYGAQFMKRMSFGRLDQRMADKLKLIGQIGLGARGLTLALIGLSLLIAAFRHRAGHVLGSSEVLTWLGYQPAGKVLLGITALGTLCYGVWCLVQARYRRIQVQG